MEFLYEGRSYETRALKQFLTEDPATPLILMTPDRKRVFVMRVDGCKGCRIQQANTLEIISLASRYGIRQLLEAFPASRVGEVELAQPPASLAG
jgi:hypothetical protein